jgi:hypothetical protein
MVGAAGNVGKTKITREQQNEAALKRSARARSDATGFLRAAFAFHGSEA